MLRMLLCSTAVLVLVAAGFVQADDVKKDNPDKKYHHATITKVDSKNHTITVTTKDKEGKEEVKVLMLADDSTYSDAEGKTAKIDAFQSGADILYIEKEGKVTELKMGGKKSGEKDKSDARISNRRPRSVQLLPEADGKPRSCNQLRGLRFSL